MFGFAFPTSKDSTTALYPQSTAFARAVSPFYTHALCYAVTIIKTEHKTIAIYIMYLVLNVNFGFSLNENIHDVSVSIP